MISLIQANSLHIPLADNSVQVCVTSPPYYGLRDYGTAQWEGGDPDCSHTVGRFEYPVSDKQRSNNGSAGHQARDVCPKCSAIRIDKQLGMEQTPEEYVARLVEVFVEIKRVLRPDGVVFLNLGDSYFSKPKSNYNGKSLGLQSKNYGTGETTLGYKQSSDKYLSNKHNGYKDKDLLGIPWRVAFALQEDGWWLRSDIIWNKTNPMPESVHDRPTKSHEYIFLLTKSKTYYYDYMAICEPAVWTEKRVEKTRGFAIKEGSTEKNQQHHGNRMTGRTMDGHKGPINADGSIRAIENEGMPVRNKRSVWTVSTKPYKGAHFATFPPELIEPCILAGSKPGDIVLDPFAGSGTTLLVSRSYGRSAIGIDLSYTYLHDQARVRLELDQLDSWSNGKKVENNLDGLPMFGGE